MVDAHGDQPCAVSAEVSALRWYKDGLGGDPQIFLGLLYYHSFQHMGQFCLRSMPFDIFYSVKLLVLFFTIFTLFSLLYCALWSLEFKNA